MHDVWIKLPCQSEEHGKPGAKGVMLSFIKALHLFSIELAHIEWFVLFEDDAELHPNLACMISAVHLLRPDALYMNLDARHSQCLHTNCTPPGCCLSGTVFHRSIIPSLEKAYDSSNPDSYISNYRTLKKEVIDNPTCLNDWMLANLLFHLKIPSVALPAIKSGGFPSTIDLPGSLSDSLVNALGSLVRASFACLPGLSLLCCCFLFLPLRPGGAGSPLFCLPPFLLWSACLLYIGTGFWQFGF